MGLLEGLEEVLDPVVVLLDNLSYHLEPDIAPVDMVDFLSGLAGMPVDDTLSIDVRRWLVMAAATIGRSRGTRAGLQVALDLAFPELDPEVRDHGEASSGRDPQAAPAVSPGSFEVRVSRTPSPGQVAQLTRCIAEHRPIGTGFRIVVAGSEGEER
jgi:phage tail-like protein